MASRATISTTIIKLMIESTRRVRGRISTLVNIQNPNKHPSRPRISPKSLGKEKKYKLHPITIDSNYLNRRESLHLMANM